MKYLNLDESSLQSVLAEEKKKHTEYVAQNLKVDITRGKPCKEQLDIALPMFDVINSSLNYTPDYRNYGGVDGIAEMKNIFAEILGVSPKNVIVGDNSSLSLMYDTVQRALQFGLQGNKPWNKLQKVKFLCPVPGYDRHFGICESFGIEMITVPMDSNGPDMDIVETMVANDDSIKGIWCVPKYSNPSGITYSDEVVERLCKMTTLAKDFRVFWDNAYVVHDLYDETDHLLNAFECATKYGNEDRFFIFTSTSKITLPGAGVACMACSESNVKEALAVMKYKTIGPNKVVQLMHYLYLQDVANIHEIMKRQAKIIRPKFEYVLANLESNFINGDIVSWTKPRGGYFISINLLKGCAKAVYGICKEAGLIITEAGATYPLRNDDFDSNLRIAPTFTSQTDLIVACDIMVNSIKIACIEKILKK